MSGLLEQQLALQEEAAAVLAYPVGIVLIPVSAIWIVWRAGRARVRALALTTLPMVVALLAIAAVQRAEAYEANRYVIEAIKERLPIWKRERFVDGSEWKRHGA